MRKFLASLMPTGVVGMLLSGLLVLILSLFIWRLTHNFIGWLVLFTPGSAMIIWAWWTGITKGWDNDE